MDVQTRCNISKWLKIEVKLLLNADRKLYMPRRLAQRMTLNGRFTLKSTSSALCAISAVVELLLCNIIFSIPISNISKLPHQHQAGYG